MTANRKQCVLVMDDSILMLELTREALEAADFCVLVAQDRAELVEHLGAGSAIDLIILDVQMPDVLGDELADGLRSQHGCRVPILLCSGHDEAALAQRARGVVGYISKQAGIDAMVAQVRRMLSSETTTAPTSS